eukprot:2072962-Rhodomonas_salina.1
MQRRAPTQPSVSLHELSDVDEMEEEPVPPAAPEKRVFGIDCNDLAANCWMVQEGKLSGLVDTLPQGTDGLIFGFAEEMRG